MSPGLTTPNFFFINPISLFSDEAWFHISAFVNRTCSVHNLHNVMLRRLIGTTFLDETINTQRYQRFFFEPFINQMDDAELTNCYFQQDWATARTAQTINY